MVVFAGTLAPLTVMPGRRPVALLTTRLRPLVESVPDCVSVEEEFAAWLSVTELVPLAATVVPDGMPWPKTGSPTLTRLSWAVVRPLSVVLPLVTDAVTGIAAKRSSQLESRLLQTSLVSVATG